MSEHTHKKKKNTQREKKIYDVAESMYLQNITNHTRGEKKINIVLKFT